MKAKLTADQVKEMIDAFKAGGVSKAALARKFGVTAPAAVYAINGKTWKHLHGREERIG